MSVVPGMGVTLRAGTLPLRWARGMRRRAAPSLDHARLRWYRDGSTTYSLTARYLVPGALRLVARVTVEGLEHVPTHGPVILAANHRDNLDGYLLIHLVPRPVHIAARPDAFGTGFLCATWRRLGAFPADSWGLRYAMDLLDEGRVVALFPQATISRDLAVGGGAVGLLAARSAAPVVPVAIVGTEKVRMQRPLLRRASIVVRFGPPLTFERRGPSAPRGREVAAEILQHIAALLDD